MSKEDAINVLIKDLDTNKISDGYHTFGELYEHRIALFIALCKRLSCLPGDFKTPYDSMVWRSLKHSDGTVWDGWFILGIGVEPETQITYHLPFSKWDECRFAHTLIQAPEWDGHTSDDVLKRLKRF